MKGFSTGERINGLSIATFTENGNVKVMVMADDTISLLPILINKDDPLDSIVFIEEVDPIVQFRKDKGKMDSTLKGKIHINKTYNECDELAHELGNSKGLSGTTELVCITPVDINNNSAVVKLYMMDVKEESDGYDLKKVKLRSLMSQLSGSHFNNPIDSSLATTVLLVANNLCWGKV